VLRRAWGRAAGSAVVGLLLAGTALLPASAETPSATSEPEARAAASPADLDAGRAPADEVLEAAPIEVEDVRARELLDDTTQERKTITREEILQQPARDVAEVVGRLPGIRTQQRVQGEEAAVSIEGLPPEYTKILVNGRRYTGQLGEVDDLSDIPVTNVERIEILRGAQALIYGAEAGGGVINVVTRKAPEAGLRAAGDAGVGSDDAYHGEGSVALRAAGVGVTTSYTHDQLGGFDPDPDSDAAFPAGGGKDSRNRLDDVYTTLERSFGGLQLDGTFGYRKEAEHLVPFDGGASSDQDIERWLGSGGASWQVDESTRLVADLAYFDSTYDSTAGRPFTQVETEPRFRLFGDRSFETGPATHLVTLGADLAWPTLDLDERSAPIAGVVPGNVDERFFTTGLVLQDEVAFGRWASLSLGVRGQLHSEFQSEVLPQTALLLRPHERFRIRASFGKNARQPSLADLHQPPVAQLGGAYFLSGNPDLAPESSRSLRAGIELEPTDAVSFSTTAFWNRIDDFVRSLPVGSIRTGETVLPAEIQPGDPFYVVCLLPDPPGQCFDQVSPILSTLYQKTNLDLVKTHGVETQLRLRPHRRVELDLGWAWLRTDVSATNLPDLHELPNEPHHVIDLGGTFRAPVTETRLTVDVRWRGPALTESSGTGLPIFSSGERSDPSWIVDLRLAQPILDDHEIYVDVRNATDTRVVDSYDVRRRTFFVGVRTAFGFAGASPTRRSF